MTKLEAEVLEKAISTILENVKFYNVCIKEDTDYKVVLYSQYFSRTTIKEVTDVNDTYNIIKDALDIRINNIYDNIISKVKGIFNKE